MTESRVSLLSRIAALLAGTAILLVALAASIGLVLLAPLGIWVMNRVQRARGRTAGSFDRWIGAVAGTTLAMLLIAGGVIAKIPADTWREIRHSADSASAEAQKQPPPAWLRHVVPSAGQTMPQAPQPVALSTIATVWGLGLGVVIAGAMLGTVGWMGTTLFMFGVSGEWLRAPPAVEGSGAPLDI